MATALQLTKRRIPSRYWRLIGLALTVLLLTGCKRLGTCVKT